MFKLYQINTNIYVPTYQNLKYIHLFAQRFSFWSFAINQCFSTGVILPPQGTHSNVWGCFSCHPYGVRGCATGTQRVEASDAAKHPAVHGTVPTAQNYPGQMPTGPG